VNVVFELVDHEFLIADDAFDKIADRDNANQLLAIEDRQVANALLSRQPQYPLPPRRTDCHFESPDDRTAWD
jgi:hypothetical protein